MNSSWWPFSAGSRQILDLAGLADQYGTLQDSSNTACTVTVTDPQGTVIQAATAMTFIEPGHWRTTFVAAVFATGSMRLFAVTVYDQSGAGTVRATFDLRASARTSERLSYRHDSINALLLSGLVDSTGAPATPLTASVYALVTDLASTVLLAATPATFVAPATWRVDLPATAMPRTDPVWVQVTVYDQSGSGGLQRWQSRPLARAA